MPAVFFKKNRRKCRCICLLSALFVLLASLCGCESYATRSEAWSTPQNTDPEPDIPVMADTEPQPQKKRVALTFDDGPQYYADRTRSIVDALDQYGFRATFFVVGNRISNNDTTLSYAVEHGCEIGIHGYTHSEGHYYDVCNDQVYEQEISKTAEAIQDAIPGYNIRLMRPVGGRITDARISQSPYSVILWSVDSDDWNNRYYAGISDEDAQAKVDTIVENVMSSVSDGDIILLHDIYESTYDATLVILQRLHEAGYEVVTVSELLGDDLQPGRAYRFAG